ncbi:MAG: crotonase/enoyl-CoA hydratase family protein [Proteobacteria bacterium]|nr:crotonase/enoyl-CoA hydratase family protein [Pseudomonadota bacterium]
MSEDVIVARENGVLTLTLNRAEKKNALTGAMYETITAEMAKANADAAIGAILILGQPGIFTSGNDIKDFVAVATSGKLSMPVLDFLKALVTNEKPLVAGVDGGAIGIGTTLMFHCDYALATARAVFATPFVDLGLVPEAGSSLIGPQLMGDRVAFEMLVMGEKFDGARAERVGLINRVVEPEALEAEAKAVAARIAAKPREAVAISRKLLRGDRVALAARMDEEAAIFGARLKSAEALAAFQAFLTKSK